MTFKQLLERFIVYGIVKEKKRIRRKTVTMMKTQTYLLLFNWILWLILSN